MQCHFTHSSKNIHIPAQMSTCHGLECDSPCSMSRVLTDSHTHAYAKCENRYLCSINDHFSKIKAFRFINQNSLDKLRYSLVFTKSYVFLWVANFQGLTAGFACLPTLSKTFIVGYIYLTKNTRFFTRVDIYPSLLYPTHVFFISFFFYATVRLILDVVPFFRAHHRTSNTVSIYHVLTTYHRTPNTVLISTMHSHPCHAMSRAYAKCHCIYLMSHA